MTGTHVKRTALAAALLSLSLAGLAAAQTYTRIDCPGFPYAHASGINDFGSIVGDCDDGAGNLQGFILRRGAFTML